MAGIFLDNEMRCIFFFSTDGHINKIPKKIKNIRYIEDRFMNIKNKNLNLFGNGRVLKVIRFFLINLFNVK